MNNRTVYENIDLLFQTKSDIASAIENTSAVVPDDMRFIDYDELIVNDISICHDNKDWNYIGYDNMPNYINDGIKYAKYMIKHRKDFSGISEHILDVSGNTDVVYLPSCHKLGINPDDISVLSFYNCYNLQYIGDNYLHTEKVKFGKTFYGCNRLRYIPKLDISTYYNPDRNRPGLFQQLYSLETIDPSNNTEYWYNTATTSYLRGFSRLFEDCYSLKTLPVINCEKLPEDYRTLNNMFSNCRSLTDVSIINTSNIKLMGSLFSGCSSLTNVPYMDTQNVTAMYRMFQYCSNLTAVPQFDTQNVSTMEYMFYGCSNLTTVPQFNTQNVSTMEYMFHSCSSLTTVPQFDTQNVTNMSSMFQYCSRLTTIPQFDTKNVTSMNGFCRYCNNLTTIEGLDFKSISSDSGSNLFIASESHTRVMYIKNIGYSSCPTYSFYPAHNWGVNDASCPDASLSIYKSLVEDTSNRVAAGSSAVNIKIFVDSANTLDNTAKAAISAKGYTLAITNY